jgi:putative glutathione S-transferase
LAFRKLSSSKTNTATSSALWASADSLDKKSEQGKFVNKDKTKGAVVRPATKFNHRIGSAEFPAAKNRYRLYVSEACPWAHRCLIVHQLKGLDAAIPVTLTGWRLANISFKPPFDNYRGWDFFGKDQDQHSYTGATSRATSRAQDPRYDEPHGFDFIDQLYESACPGFRASYEEKNQRPYYSVPVLYDTLSGKIVNNESSAIVEMLNSDFNEWAERPGLELAPAHLAQTIEEVNATVYPHINDGVYRMGFATTQQAYENAYDAHWQAMDDMEARLGKSRFLTSDTEVTLADVRLFVSLARYDIVYFSHFKASRNRLSDMPNLSRYLRDLFRIPEFGGTTNLHACKFHYYESQRMLNPEGVYPKGPNVDYIYSEEGLAKKVVF